MFYKIQRRLILGLLLIPAVLGPDPFINTDSDDDKYILRPVFESLRQYGLTKVDAERDTKTHLKQYMVAAVLTEYEYKNAKSWSMADLDLLMAEHRVKIFLNNNTNKMSIHGEIEFLYNKNTGMEFMVEKVREKVNDTSATPFIILFSHYIPCANLRTVKYSCSEELASASNSYGYPMFIAFSEVWKDTDEAEAINNLKWGRTINVFMESKNYDLYYIPAKGLSDSDTFQSLYSKCLTDMEVSRCGDRVVEDTLKAVYVNRAVYECTKDSPNRGMLTRSNRKQFIDCFNDFINSCSGCNSCSYREILVRNVFKFCAVNVLRTGLAFGQARYLQDTSWHRTDGPWKYIVSTPVEDSRLPLLPCYVRKNVMNDCLKALRSPKLPQSESMTLFHKLIGAFKDMKKMNLTNGTK